MRLQCPKQGPVVASHVRDAYHAQAEEGFKSYEDFYSGSCLRDFSESLKGVNRESAIDFVSCLPVVYLFVMPSADGAPAFKSPTSAFWPVVLFLGSLPPDDRYHDENVIPVT